MNEGNGNTQLFRITALEKRVGELSSVVQNAIELRFRVAEVEKDMDTVNSELARIRRGMWVAAATFASMSVGIFTLVIQGIK